MTSTRMGLQLRSEGIVEIALAHPTRDFSSVAPT
jgi:hypothetical protein